MSIVPGIYDISDIEYHNSEGISRSDIMIFRKTPFHYWNEKLNPNRPPKDDEDTAAIRMGKMIHCYLLEPEKFSERYLVIEKINKTTKRGKEYAEQCEKLKGSRELVYDFEVTEIQAIEKAISQNPQAKELIAGAEYEKSFYWTDPHTGLLCKARPDIIHANMVCDLKTALSASRRDFQTSLYTYGAYIQAGMIHVAMKEVMQIDMKNFIYIVLEKNYPYAHAIYKLDELAIEQGIVEFKNTLLRIKECLEKNEWPSYETSIITLPAWAANETGV
jgi:exodeoxyribonuclease VIII